MRKKKIAWLLTAVMLATSVDGSALLVNGADFTSGAEETQETDVQDTPEEVNVSDGEAEDAESLEANAEMVNKGEETRTVTKLEVVSKPKTEYVEGIDYGLNESLTLQSVTLAGMKVRVYYSDGTTEDYAEENYSIGNPYYTRYFDWGDDDQIRGVIAVAGTESIEIPFKKIPFVEYLQTLDKSTLETLQPGMKKELKGNTASEYLFKITPSRTGIYTWKTGCIDNYSYPVKGYLLDENGKILQSMDGQTNYFEMQSEVTKGQTYYYLIGEAMDKEFACTLETSYKRSLKEISLSSTDVDKYLDVDRVSDWTSLLGDINVKLIFSDGEEETIKCENGESTSDGYEVEIIPPDDMEDIKAGNSYTAEVRVGNKSTQITVHIKPWYEYCKKSGQDLILDKKVTVNTKNEDTNYFYTFTAPEDGEYTFTCDDYYVDVNHTMWIRTEDGIEDKADSTLSAVLKKGEKIYLKIYSEAKYFGALDLIAEKADTKVEIEAKLADTKTAYTYTGKEIEPEILVTSNGKTLEKDVDYQITYYDNINAGEGWAEIKPVLDKLKFDTTYVYYMIEEREIQETDCSDIPDQIYTGEALTPSVKVIADGRELNAGTDYRVFYENNTAIGTATVKISGTGNYTGEITKTFKITSKLVNKLILNKTSATVTAGNSLQLSAKTEPTDAYNKKVTWTSSDPKLATVSASGKVTVKSTATGGSLVKITATAADGSKVSAVCTIKISNKITYNLNGGKQNKNNKTTFCKQTVKLYAPTRNGYTFGGWYTDKTLKKKITSISSKTVKNVTLYAKWNKVSKCNAPTGVTLKNSAAKTMSVSCKTVAGAQGYEISYAANSRFSGAKKVVITSKNTSIKGLKKGQTYYVRIRAYKKDSTGAKIYGNYSKTTKITLKK